MPKFDFKQLDKSLDVEGIQDPQVKEKIVSAIKSLPEKTYDKAVIFLGYVTLLVAVGGILLAALNKTVPDALWTALGAGIGGLAGIFTGKN